MQIHLATPALTSCGVVTKLRATSATATRARQLIDPSVAFPGPTRKNYCNTMRRAIRNNSKRVSVCGATSSGASNRNSRTTSTSNQNTTTSNSNSANTNSNNRHNNNDENKNNTIPNNNNNKNRFVSLLVIVIIITHNNV